MFQMGGVGPMLGQFGHFYKFAADKVANNSYPMERYRDEAKRLLGVLEGRLEGPAVDRSATTYTVADIALLPRVRGADIFYGGARRPRLWRFSRV